MNFNGKTLIIVGSLFFFFQLINFFSIDSITPALERAQVLAAITSIIIILIGFLFEQFNPISSKKVELDGENDFIFDPNIPENLLNDGQIEAILTPTAAATYWYIMTVKILRRGITSNRTFTWETWKDL